jgi:hypothetical protein
VEVSTRSSRCWLVEELDRRPTCVLTDGKCEADKADKKDKPYKIVEGDGYKGYTVSRADIAHFIVEEAVLHWDQWKGKILAVGY